MDKSPDAFRTISEVADWLDTPAHVLRFWESRFTQVKPIKRAGGRRYYRPADMALLGGIKKLLHDDGMTIRGVQKLLREHGVKYVASLSPVIEGVEPITAPPVTNSPIPPTPKPSAPVQLAVVETPPEPAQPAQELEPAPVRTPVPPAPMAEMVSQEDYEAEQPEETVVPFSRSEPVSPDSVDAQPESDAPEVAAEAVVAKPEVSEPDVAEAPVFTAHTEEIATDAPTEPEQYDPSEMPIAMDEAETGTYESEAMTESLFDMTNSSEADEADSMAEQATFDFDLSESFADHDPDPTLVETDEAELPADAPLATPTEAEAPATPERLPLGAALDLPEDPEDTAPEITPAASVLGQLDHRKLMTMPTDEITALVARIETLRARLAG
ncbi:MerR family transcriptional regulator [Celeribacter halophilus]|uniref:MerR family transcriptional regulator n=1 Tax=Celeribacter halophilus TaxID=576117 RepID=A0AAW7XS94_9RHOB|nr:MerR family transcriptional regulator [Celeribacter halophilus]MDO6455708.1 MerR family transcriptional regulator [Celeribacter halophilus]MDO6721898.1 MerR family transcriptional regulator [Celeribacter halophilus]